jgi:hypothetical protein
MKYSCSKSEEAALRAHLDKIESAEAGLSGAEALVEKVATKRNSLAVELNRRWDAFDPLDDEALADCAQLRIEIQNLDFWLTNPPVLRRLADDFARELAAAKPLIQAFAQTRCGAEQVISRCFWNQILVGMEMKPISTQIHGLRQVATEVGAALRVLLEARRGIELTADEKRSGIVQRGYGLGNRPLSFEEKSAGFAFE